MDPLKTAKIEWGEEGNPLSVEYEDVYFSREDGLQETEHVFLEGNRLPERFSSLIPGAGFSIGELGFGTGLNFYAARHLFLNTAPRESRLRFVSCELHPFESEDFQRFFVRSPFAKDGVLQDVVAGWREFAPGFRRRILDRGRVILDLYLGEANDFLKDLADPLDAWFLDGFSPSRNPAMWEESLLELLGEKTRRGGSCATFSSAGHVRRSLEKAGFQVQKAPGFGRKKEMIRAEKISAEKSVSRGPGGTVATVPETSVAVIGGGIAGAGAAFAFARRGYDVTLLERDSDVARGASGNHAGVAFPFLNAEPTAMSRYLLQGFFYLRELRDLLQKAGVPVLSGDTGVIQLAHETRQKRRFEKALANLGYDSSIVSWRNRDDIEELCGFRTAFDGVEFPGSFWVRPPDLVRGLLHLCGEKLTLKTDTEVTRLKYRENRWDLLNARGDILQRSSIVIVAAGFESRQFSQIEHASIRRNRGQVVLIHSTERSRGLKRVVCYDGYVIPEVEGLHVVGADYNRERFDLEVDPEISAAIIKKAGAAIPDLFPQEGPEISGGKAGIRAMGLDHLPLIGAVPDYDAFQKSGKIDVLPGLYLSAGHGSRGLSYAPLGGEILASLVEGREMPVELDLIRALDPLRFLFRELRRSGSVVGTGVSQSEGQEKDHQ